VKVAVLASPEDGLTLLPILETLALANVEAYGLKIGRGWQGLPRATLARHFDKATHYLLLATERSRDAAWFAFAIGYGIGNRSGTAVYRDDPERGMPRCLAGLPVIDTLDELAAYYQAERAEWLYQEERRSARAALLEMGVSFHSDSLAQCVKDGDAKAVELFLKAGFPTDTRDRHGVPLLCLAARSRHKLVAELLLDQGAILDNQSEDRGYTPLMDAAHAGAAELLDLFLSRGADPDLKSKDGQTALVVAVGRNDPDSVRLLFDYGADGDIPDKLGLTARKYAGLFKNPAILPLFETSPRAGAD
jgi:hypothetical protein